MRSRFKFINRGFEDNILFIPGWAADYRIFSALELNYNYLLPLEFNPFDFEDNLSEFIDSVSILNLSLFGWSLGAYLAASFAAQNLEKIKELIMLSLRRNYDPEILKSIGLKLKKNKQAYLYKFYQDCFSKDDKAGLSWFKDNLFKDYLKDLELEELLTGLDYLSSVKIEPELLSGVKNIKILHGRDDRVAPFNEAEAIALRLPGAKFIPMNTGHVPFLNPDFKGKLNG